MSKRKSTEPEQFDRGDANALKRSHRNESSSSSTSGEWMCASTRVPLPGEALSFSLNRARKSTVSASPKQRVQEASKKLTIPNMDSSWLPFACTAAASALLTIRDSPDDEPRTSATASAPRKRRTIKVSDLRRASLPLVSTHSKSLRKTSSALDPDKLKWPSFPISRRKSAVLEEVESPLKNDWSARVVERTPSPQKQSSSLETTVVDSQQDVSSVYTRSSEDDRCDTLQSIGIGRGGSCTFDRKRANDKRSVVGASAVDNLVTSMLLESSPDEALSASPMKCIVSTPVKSDASNEVPATQDVVAESDDGEHVPSEKFYVDESSRLNSNPPSAVKQKPGAESEEDSNSSDDEEGFSRKTVMRMNLTGIAREFAEYLLLRQSERAMAKRDPDIPTVTYEVMETVSAWGMSVSWLSPKAIMYAPPFVRSPATVTLALPLETLPDESDPETQIIINPVIVATTQQVVAADAAEH